MKELTFADFAQIIKDHLLVDKKQNEVVLDLFKYIYGDNLPDEISGTNERNLRNYFNGTSKISRVKKIMGPTTNVDDFGYYFNEEMTKEVSLDSLVSLYKKLAPYCDEEFDLNDVYSSDNGVIIGNLFLRIINECGTRKQRAKNTCREKCSLVLDKSKCMPEFYKEREKEVLKLYDSFTKDEAPVRVITGTHGTGKTQFAHYFSKVARNNKWFNKVVFTTYNTSLENTIASLETSGEFSGTTDAEGMFKAKLRLLRALGKNGKALLIIDNYYNPLRYTKELSINNNKFRELLDTGCKVIFTTTTSINNCHGTRAVEIEPLPLEELVTLFRDVKGDSDDDDQEIKTLIEKCLLYNVYLVILSAEIIKQGKTVRELIQAFEECSVEDMDVYDISIEKDGECQEKDMLQHFCTVLDNNVIIHPRNEETRKLVHKALTLLSMLPIGGIKESDFYKLAYENEHLKDARKIILILKHNHLAFVKEGNLYIHPLVREYIIRNIKAEAEYIYTYVKNVVDHLRVETFSDDFMYWLSIGRELNMLLNKDAVINRDVSEKLKFYLVVLQSYLASCYDIIKHREQAYQYGVEALKALDEFDWKSETEDNKLLLASCYNVVGYAILHRKTENDIQRKKDRDMAYRAISSVEIVLEGVSHKNASYLLTKVHGNQGAVYIDAGDYDSALEKHTIALKERELLAEKDDSNEIKALLASSYLCLGTDWFYLRKTGELVECLAKSYKYHRLSLELVEKVYGRSSLEMAIGSNRLIGTGLELINALKNDDSLKELSGDTFDEMISDFYELLEESVAFFAETRDAINNELRITLNNVEKLTELCKLRKILTDDKISFNKDVADKLCAIPELDESDLEKLKNIAHME